MNDIRIALGVLVCITAIAGCARSSGEQLGSSQINRYQLTAEPAGAIDVIDFREQAKDGQAVVVLGRIGGGVKPWIEGRAAFVLADERVSASCEEECDENCTLCAEELASATTLVKVLGEDGKVVPVDARKLLGLADNQIVVVRGIANRDKGGNVSISAEGIYTRR